MICRIVCRYKSAFARKIFSRVSRSIPYGATGNGILAQLLCDFQQTNTKRLKIVSRAIPFTYKCAFIKPDGDSQTK